MDTVRVALLRPLHRQGAYHAPGDRVIMPVAEAQSMIERGFAEPAAPDKPPQSWWTRWLSCD